MKIEDKLSEKDKSYKDSSNKDKCNCITANSDAPQVVSNTIS